MAKKDKTEEVVTEKVVVAKKKPLGGTILTLTVGAAVGVYLGTSETVKDIVSSLDEQATVFVAGAIGNNNANNIELAERTYSDGDDLVTEEFAVSVENLEGTAWENVYPELEGVIPNPSSGVIMPIQSNGWHLYEVEVLGMGSPIAYIKLCSAYGFTLQPIVKENNGDFSLYMQKDSLLLHLEYSGKTTHLKLGIDPVVFFENNGEIADLDELLDELRVDVDVVEEALIAEMLAQEALEAAMAEEAEAAAMAEEEEAAAMAEEEDEDETTTKTVTSASSKTVDEDEEKEEETTSSKTSSKTVDEDEEETTSSKTSSKTVDEDEEEETTSSKTSSKTVDEDEEEETTSSKTSSKKSS